MEISLTLLTAGPDQGVLFNLFSNIDGFTTAFETDVPLSSLLAGYTTTVAPMNTEIVRICGQEARCLSCLDIYPAYTTTTSTTSTTTTLPPVACNESTSSGGPGITEFVIPLETIGGVLVMDFNPQGVPDKLEILHNGIKVATSGFIGVANAGPFDDIYGDPLVPTVANTLIVDQFIGTNKDVAPTRAAELLSETGLSFTLTYQQFIWFTYDANDVINDLNAVVRITGPVGTGWNVKRHCEEITTTTTTTTVVITTTTTTTEIPQPMIAAISAVGIASTDACGETQDAIVYVHTINTPGSISVGDIVYNNNGFTSPLLGGDKYYKLGLALGALDVSAQIDNNGVIIGTMTIC